MTAMPGSSRAQANKIAKLLKAIGRDEHKPADDPTGKIVASKAAGILKFAVAMADAVLIIEMPWAVIHDASEFELSDYIIEQMRREVAP